MAGVHKILTLELVKNHNSGDTSEEGAKAVSVQGIDFYVRSACMLLDESPYSESLKVDRIVPFHA